MPLSHMVGSCCYEKRLLGVKLKMEEKQKEKEWSKIRCSFVAWNGPTDDMSGEKHQQALFIGPLPDVSSIDQVVKLLDECKIAKDWLHLHVNGL